MRPSDREAVRCGHLNPTPLFGPNGRQCGRSTFDRERLLSKVGVLVPGDVPGFRHPTRADGLPKCQKWLPAHLNSHLANGETEESSHLLGMARLHSFAVTGPSARDAPSAGVR